MKYWLGVVSKEHVLKGVKEEIAQVCHGKKGPLSKMKPGDGLIYYSPKISMHGQERCQTFTAIGRIKTGAAYQVKLTEEFQPFRLDVEYLPSVEVPISALFDQLNLTRCKNWGMQLRRGLVELTKADFMMIASAMGVKDWKNG